MCQDHHRLPLELSAIRKQLLVWFRKEALPLADAYAGALYLLADREFPGRVHFIAHAVRDIADRLVFVLDPQLNGSRVDYESALDVIAKEWPDMTGVANGAGIEPSPGAVQLDFRLAVRVDRLVRTHRERRQRPSRFELLFRHLMRNEVHHAALNQRLVDDFKRVRQSFMAVTHLRTDAAPHLKEEELQQNFNRFETILHSFVGDFFTGQKALDDILQRANERAG